MIRNFQDGDIVTSGPNQFVTTKESTANGIYHRLRMFFGEFFLDVNQGTPWFQSILGKVPQDVAELNIKQRILTSKDVVAITEFNFNSDANQRKLEIQVGIIDINNEQVQFVLNEEIF